MASITNKRQGVPNIGNTCYLNSLYQLLYSIEPVREFITQFNYLIPEILTKSPNLLHTFKNITNSDDYEKIRKTLTADFGNNFGAVQQSELLCFLLNKIFIYISGTETATATLTYEHIMIPMLLFQDVNPYTRQQDPSEALNRILNFIPPIEQFIQLSQTEKKYYRERDNNQIPINSNNLIEIVNTKTKVVNINIKIGTEIDLNKYIEGINIGISETDNYVRNNELKNLNLTDDEKKNGVSFFTQEIYSDYKDYVIIYFPRAIEGNKRNDTKITLTDDITLSEKKYILQGSVCHFGSNSSSGHYIFEDKSGNSEYDDSSKNDYLKRMENTTTLASSWTMALYKNNLSSPGSSSSSSSSSSFDATKLIKNFYSKDSFDIELWSFIFNSNIKNIENILKAHKNTSQFINKFFTNAFDIQLNALMYQAQYGTTDHLNILCNNPAIDVNLKNKQEKTALDFAIDGKNENNLLFLLDLEKTTISKEQSNNLIHRVNIFKINNNLIIEKIIKKINLKVNATPVAPVVVAPLNTPKLTTVLEHQKGRFEQLTQILNTNTDAKVIIAGKDDKHSLGIYIAKNSWDPTSYKLMEENLNMLVNNLKVAFPKRVEFGNVGWSNSPSSSFSQTDSKKNPSINWIHVWGANENNWNLKKGDDISGAGQAAAMKKQVAGVFGICTMPTNNAEKLVVIDSSLKMHLLEPVATPVATTPVATTPVATTPVATTPVATTQTNGIAEIAEANTLTVATPSSVATTQTNGIAEIAEAITPTTATPTTATPTTATTPVATTQTNGIAEIAEANTLTPVATTPLATPVVSPQTNGTAEIFEALAPTLATPTPVATTTQSPVATPVLSTTINKTKDNKPHPYTPFDFDAFVATIPPTLVAPSTPPAILPALATYIVNVEFCYRFLYFVRNNKNNQTDELKTIAKIIMEYYAPNDMTYFNFELKKIDLTNKTNKNIDDITIYTNKGRQTLKEMLKDVSVVAQVVAPQVVAPAPPVAQVGTTQVAPINTKIPETTKIVSETNAFRASQQKAQIKFFESMNIKILTYNVNHDSKGQSRVNIMSILKEGEYDIIGIQESYDENLQISDEYDKVTSNVNKTGKFGLNFNATIITFYKKKRFEIKDDIYYGNCNNTLKNSARPYHIITLLDKITNTDIYVINLHNEHEDTKKYKLETTLTKGYSQPSNNHKTSTSTTLTKNTQKHKFTNNNKNAIVVMGDFNTEYYFKQGILNITGLKGVPPKSCCDNTYSKGGDYILTNGFKESENTIANKMKDASDHYPVIRILKYEFTYDPDNISIDYHIHYINSLPSNDRESIINKIIESKKFTDQDIINKLLDECLIESNPSKPSNPQTATGIYHEKQVGALCGIHALNNALQKQVFYKGDATAINTFAFIDVIKNDKTVKDTDRDAALKNQNYLASTIVEAIKLVANNNEYYEMTPSQIQATYNENEILQGTIQNGTVVDNEVLLTDVVGNDKKLRDFRIVFNKRNFHYTSAFFKGKQWIYLDSMNKNPIMYDTFNKLVTDTFKIPQNSDVALYISNLPWMCAFIPDSKYDGITTKGGRVRHCQKTIKKRKSKSKSKSKSKGITIKMH